MTHLQKKTLSDWLAVATLVCTILFHMLHTEARLAKVEQKIDDMREELQRRQR